MHATIIVFFFFFPLNMKSQNMWKRYSSLCFYSTYTPTFFFSFFQNILPHFIFIWSGESFLTGSTILPVVFSRAKLNVLLLLFLLFTPCNLFDDIFRAWCRFQNSRYHVRLLKYICQRVNDCLSCTCSPESQVFPSACQVMGYVFAGLTKPSGEECGNKTI